MWGILLSSLMVLRISSLTFKVIFFKARSLRFNVKTCVPIDIKCAPSMFLSAAFSPLDMFINVASSCLASMFSCRNYNTAFSDTTSTWFPYLLFTQRENRKSFSFLFMLWKRIATEMLSMMRETRSENTIDISKLSSLWHGEELLEFTSG